MRQTQRFTGYPDELFDVVVPRLKIDIANRPIDGDSFAQIRGEIQITPPIGLPSPEDRAATYLPSTNPAKWFVFACGVGVLRVFHEKLRIRFFARVTQALNWLFLL